jgi:hypothetical protein
VILAAASSLEWNDKRFPPLHFSGRPIQAPDDFVFTLSRVLKDVIVDY